MDKRALGCPQDKLGNFLPQVSHLFFKTAIVFLIVGIGVRLQMAITDDHSVFPSPAHINLLGWVTSAIFGGYYALNLAKAQQKVAMIHFSVYTFGVVLLTPALCLVLRRQSGSGAHRGHGFRL